MNNLSKTLLTFKPTILHEADEESKYGLPDEVINGTAIEAPADAPAENNIEEPPAEGEVDPNAVPEDTGEDQPIEDDPTSVDDETEGLDSEYSDSELDDDGDLSMQDIETEAEQTPGLRILTSISDKQYKLCNIELYKKFYNLANEVSDMVNNVLMDIKPTSDRQAQVLEIVHNNLSSMITDLHNYMEFSFNDTYESNVIAYCTFMKRYKIAIDIIATFNKKPEQNDKSQKA